MEAYQNLHGIAFVRSTRTLTNDDVTTASHYCVFSHVNMTPKGFPRCMDGAHARVENIAIVLNLLRKFAPQMLKHDKTLTGFLTGKREMCAWRYDLAINVIQYTAVPLDFSISEAMVLNYCKPPLTHLPRHAILIITPNRPKRGVSGASAASRHP